MDFIDYPNVIVNDNRVYKWSFNVVKMFFQSDRSKGIGGMEPEAIAGILLACIFAFFILTYTLLLQCWWKCKMKRRVGRHDNFICASDLMSSDGKGDCACFAQAVISTWEQVDLEKCISGDRASDKSYLETLAGKTS